MKVYDFLARWFKHRYIDLCSAISPTELQIVYLTCKCTRSLCVFHVPLCNGFLNEKALQMFCRLVFDQVTLRYCVHLLIEALPGWVVLLLFGGHLIYMHFVVGTFQAIYQVAIHIRNSNPCTTASCLVFFVLIWQIFENWEISKILKNNYFVAPNRADASFVIFS